MTDVLIGHNGVLITGLTYNRGLYRFLEWFLVKTAMVLSHGNALNNVVFGKTRLGKRYIFANAFIDILVIHKQKYQDTM